MQTSEYGALFREEASELLEELEQALLALEKEPDNREVVHQIFRALHTIKGSGAMFGFDRLAGFAHELENAYDQVRQGHLAVSKELIDLTLRSLDLIRQALRPENAQRFSGEEQGLLRDLSRLLLSDTVEELLQEKQARPTSGGTPEPPPPEQVHLYRIRFIPDRRIADLGVDLNDLLQGLRELGECEIIAQTRDIPVWDSFNPEELYLFWDILLLSNRPLADIQDHFLFVEDHARLEIQIIHSSESWEGIPYRRLGEILVDRGDISPEEITRVLKQQQPLGNLLLKEGLTDEDALASALAEQKLVRQSRAQAHNIEQSSTLRVPAQKLDMLVDLVGELVTLQARLGQISADLEDGRVTQVSEEMERLVWTLRDNTMSIRMIPISSTFNRYQRLVRDLSDSLGKQVLLKTTGGDTELDKTVIEKLSDPLVHIIRNAIDHGLEPPQERLATGKPPEGTIHLSACHAGADVLVEVRDDGRGLPVETIRAKALAQGLIAPDKDLTNAQIHELILLPGFSTAQTLTDVSGRGVGMDVVKKSVDALRGQISIDSTEGKGTRFTLKIPLTLAIIDGLLTTIGSQHYVLPLHLVEECIEVSSRSIRDSNGQHQVRVREELVPYIPLRDLFRIREEEPEFCQVVIVRLEQLRVGLVVDAVVGQHQTVIKSLGPAYREAEGFSGATILGNGSIALIMDIPRILSMSEPSQRV